MKFKHYFSIVLLVVASGCGILEEIFGMHDEYYVYKNAYDRCYCASSDTMSLGYEALPGGPYKTIEEAKAEMCRHKQNGTCFETVGGNCP